MMLFLWLTPSCWPRSLSSFSSVIIIIPMSNEFNSKIQNLSNKLNSLHKPNKKELQVDQLKYQLSKLEQSLRKQLNNAQKRIEKIQYKLSKKVTSSKRSQMAIKSVWTEKQQKVSELIGSWVQNYQEQVEQALQLLQRQQKSYQIKLQEEQQVINKEVRIEENRVKDLIHTASKEIIKLQSIHSQQQTAVIKELTSAKELMNQSLRNCAQTMQEQQQIIPNRLKKAKENIVSLQSKIEEDLESKCSKLKHVMRLLLDIE